MLDDPSFVPNRNALRDCANVAVGIVWQLCLTSLPIFLVLHAWKSAGTVLVLLQVGPCSLPYEHHDAHQD
jgi:hypothetical protein